MRKFRSLAAWALALCLLIGLLPLSAAPVSSETTETGTLNLTGNTGAVLTCDFTPLSAEIDNNDLAIVEIRETDVL